MTLQSAAGLADIHTAHQPGFEHLSYADTLHTQDEQHAVSGDLSSHDEHDCDHCCYCHGHFTAAIALASDRSYFGKSISPVPEYFDKAFPDTSDTFLRPPIA